MKIELEINGARATLTCEPHEMLTEVLRRHGLTGVKRGCETGDCGACSILLDDEEVPSCLMLAAQADGHRITTIEGIGDFASPHPIQLAFVDATAVQCGFCTPGMVVATKALLAEKPEPTNKDVRECLAGHPCRCTGHKKPIEAVLAAAEALRARPTTSDGGDDPSADTARSV
jgi:aerobic-type carbon monoxide dehydrogenase small subunit (CoxS/CutS family)